MGRKENEQKRRKCGGFVHWSEVNGSQWQSMAVNGSQWQSMAVNGSQWQSMAVNGSEWK
jgi:hypothetical protein